MARTKFIDFINEDWTAHVSANKDGTSYTVNKMGKKLAAHGGLKAGEKIGDSDMDSLKDSQIKFKIKPYKPVKEAIQRRMDRKVIIATDPATGRKVVKIAPKREIDIGKGRMESVEVNELDTSTIASYQKKAGKEYGKLKKSDKMHPEYAAGLEAAGKMTTKDADKQSKNYDKYKKRGEGLAKSKKILAKRYSDKQVRMGKGVAFDKRYKQGNYSGASKAINKIKKGLADHPKVATALRKANEQFNKEGE